MGLVDFNWIEVPSGEFMQGSSIKEVDKAYNQWKDKLLDPRYEENFRDWLLKEYPKHAVYLKRFLISDIPITNKLYKLFCNEQKVNIPESLQYSINNLMHPVWGVTHEEALSFCTWLSEQLDMDITLPSEGQWEYASRGPTSREYPWGSNFDFRKCNSIEAAIGDTTEVRKYKQGRSYFGLYDMAGNVEEWTNTTYAPYKHGEFVSDDLIDTLGSNYFVLKGGSFARGGDLCRVARRHGRHPEEVFKYTGFRVVCNF